MVCLRNICINTLHKGDDDDDDDNNIIIVIIILVLNVAMSLFLKDEDSCHQCVHL